MKLSTRIRKIERQRDDLADTLQRRMQFIDQYPGGFRCNGQVIYGSDVYPILQSNPDTFIDDTINAIYPKLTAIDAALAAISRLLPMA